MLRSLFTVVLLQATLGCSFGQDPQPNCRDQFRKELEANPANSLVHFQLGECFHKLSDLQSAANEFRAALDGDLEPSWTKVWSHINLGKIFDVSGQRDRALREYRLAEETHDNTRGAQDEVAKYQQSPYKRR